jgi:hypothetical protein
MARKALLVKKERQGSAFTLAQLNVVGGGPELLLLLLAVVAMLLVLASAPLARLSSRAAAPA